MAMFVWPDGTVTGSVNVEELDRIREAQKGVSKKRLAALGPIESAEHLAGLLSGESEQDDPQPEPEPEQSELETKPAATKVTPKKASH